MTPPRRPASTASASTASVGAGVPEPVELSLRKKLLFYSVLGALVVLAGVAAEGVLRLAMPDLKYAYAAPIDPETGYGVTLGHRFSLNSLGIREAEFPVPRPAEQTRVLCLGDSITFGYGLPYESAWPKLLEARLRQRYAGEDIFCINAAGNAATTHQALALYRETAHAFGAGTVVLGFCMNDVRLARHSNDVKSNDVKSVALSRRGSGLRAWRFELRRSYLFSALDLGMTEAIKRHVYPLSGKSWLTSHPYQLNALGMTQVAGQAWRDTLASLRELQSAVAADGARLVVTAFPYQFQISDDPRDNPYRIDKTQFRIDAFARLERFCRENGIALVSLLEEYSGAREEMITGQRAWDDLFIDYCHPSHAGQQIAALAIYRTLVGEDPEPFGRPGRALKTSTACSPRGKLPELRGSGRQAAPQETATNSPW